MTNKKKVSRDRAGAMLDEYAGTIGEEPNAIKDMRDLLADLRHYCDAVEIDWADVLQQSQAVYETEEDLDGKE